MMDETGGRKVGTDSHDLGGNPHIFLRIAQVDGGYAIERLSGREDYSDEKVSFVVSGSSLLLGESIIRQFKEGR